MKAEEEEGDLSSRGQLCSLISHYSEVSEVLKVEGGSVFAILPSKLDLNASGTREAFWSDFASPFRLQTVA